MDEHTTLAIWMESGKTLQFIDVTDFNDNATTVEFSYFGQRSQEKRHAIFRKNMIAGYAVTE
ncbi:hypothetical protein IV38_GL000102 [Lactobacillus selangorensis]|uniref:Uncharacterized protein n=1 Tax=Lactobacillus selangorensis TaxID=81857 RepID=A0A0R2FNE7_9LACO|nr:hypothetical protein [Lactobacillus selangorensis]KRN29222.1 hypothetical protein IV38_GL000102 [Lactobacillus selangorensis]KRN31420.1 hypothetical protein IV40_GL001416 [Lactobacillus selangorensis]